MSSRKIINIDDHSEVLIIKDEINPPQKISNKPKKKVSFNKTLKIIYVENWKSFNQDVSITDGCKEWDKAKRKKSQKTKNIKHKKEKNKNIEELNQNTNYYNSYYFLDDSFGSYFGYCLENYFNSKSKCNNNNKNKNKKIRKKEEEKDTIESDDDSCIIF